MLLLKKKPNPITIIKNHKKHGHIPPTRVLKMACKLMNDSIVDFNTIKL